MRRMCRPPGTGAGRWLALGKFVGWPRSQWRNLVTCIRRESSGNPRASNGICDGLMQIHRCHHIRNVFDPLVNLRYGLRLWKRTGWAASWTTM